MNKVTPVQVQAAIESQAPIPPDTRNAHERLLDVMKDVDYIQKDRTIGTYKVVTHDAVTAKVRPVLVKHGLVYYPQNLVHAQNGNRTEIRCDIVFVNAKQPTDFIAVPTLGYGIDAQDKGPGKAISYAVKMALLKALGLETGEDADDGAGVDHKPEAKAEAPAKVSEPDKVKNAPGISEAKTWAREHIRDLENSENGDEFLTTIETVRGRWAKVCAVYPNLWQGPDGSGLRGEGTRLATTFQCRPGFDAFLKEVEVLAHEIKNPPAQAAQ